MALRPKVESPVFVHSNRTIGWLSEITLLYALQDAVLSSLNVDFEESDRHVKRDDIVQPFALDLDNLQFISPTVFKKPA